MTDLRAALLARLDALLATCDEALAEPPWHGSYPASYPPLAGLDAGYVRLIAAHGPVRMRPVWKKIEWEVRAHTAWEGACVSIPCRNTYLEYPCGFLREWATALGVTADEPSEATS